MNEPGEADSGEKNDGAKAPGSRTWRDALGRARVACPALFVAAMVPRVVFVSVIGLPAIVSDAERNLRYARVLWEHGVYGPAPGAPTAADAIFYPLFLAPFVGGGGDTPTAALWAQMLLTALCPCLAFLVARALGGALAGWMAGLLTAGYPPMWVFSAQYLAGALAGVWLFVLLWSGDRTLRGDGDRRGVLDAAGLGAFHALHALTRVAAFPVVAASAGLLLLSRWRRPRRCLLSLLALVGAFVLVYSPWVLRNALVLDEPIVLTAKKGYTANFAWICAENVAKGMTLIEARKATSARLRRQGAGKLGADARFSRFSWTYVRHCFQRFLIMLGLHPCLDAPYPLTGTTVDFFPPLRWYGYAWHAVMLACAFMAGGFALLERNVRLAHVFLIPFCLLCLYAAVHAITRYQVPIFFAWSVAAGIGAQRALSASVAPFRRSAAPASPDAA